MAYRVIFAANDGNRYEVNEVHLTPIPSLGDLVEVSIQEQKHVGRVMGIRTSPSKSPGTAVEGVDHVDVRELPDKEK
jgi:hypothetical protein